MFERLLYTRLAPRGGVSPHTPHARRLPAKRDFLHHLPRAALRYHKRLHRPTRIECEPLGQLASEGFSAAVCSTEPSGVKTRRPLPGAGAREDTLPRRGPLVENQRDAVQAIRAIEFGRGAQPDCPPMRYASLIPGAIQAETSLLLCATSPVQLRRPNSPSKQA